MKKMPIVKRILAAALVVAMVAASAKYDWSALIGKAEEWGTTVPVSAGGSIAQTITVADSAGTTAQKVTKISVQASLSQGQTAEISGRIYQNCTSVENLSGNGIALSTVSKSTTEPDGETLGFDLVPASDVYLAEGESAVVVLSVSGFEGNIYIYQTTSDSSQTFVKQTASSNYANFGKTICITTLGSPVETSTLGDVTGISVAPTSIVMNVGDSVKVTPTLTPNLKRAVTTSDYDGAVVAVGAQAEDGSFSISGSAAGTTGVKFSCGGATPVVVPVTVLNATISPTGITYGDAVPTVTVSNGTGSLTEDTHYTVSRDEAAHKITIDGLSGEGFDYTGYHVEKTYTVTARNISSADPASAAVKNAITGGSYEFNFTTNTLTSVNVPGMTENVDFKVNNVVRKSVVGQSITYTLTVEGIGNYCGTIEFDKTVTATGVKVDISDVAVLGNITPKKFTGSAIEVPTEIKFYSVTDPDQEITIPTTNYKIVYSNNTNSGTATVTAQGIGDYTGEISTTFKINKVNLSEVSIDAISDQGYTGSAIEPPLTVTYNGYTLSKGTDYSVTYSGNINVGTNTGKATLTGTKNFKGTKEVTFSIVGSLNSAEVTLENAYVASAGDDTGYSVTYTGAAITPEVTSLEIGGTELDLDNYNVTYDANTDAGTARVNITDKTDSTKTTYVTFEIKKRSLASPQEVSFAPASVPYTTVSTSSSVAPTVKLKYNGTVHTLVKGTDYTVEYENDIDVGTVKATIKGMKNFTGEKVVGSAYTITPLDAKNTQIEVSDMVYTGAALEPTPKVKTLAGKEIGAENYDVTWDNNVDVGEATVTITGKNFLTGTNSKKFQIKACDLYNNVTFYLDNQEYGTTSDDTITFGEALNPLTKEYTGTAVSTNIRLKDQNGNIISPTNYEARYENNESVSTTTPAKVIITGKNKYRNQTVTLEFKISQKSLGDGTNPGTGITATYDKNTGEIVVRDANRAAGHQKLKDSGSVIDYTVTWGGDPTAVASTYNATAGQKTATITGVGNYTGSYTLNYNVGTDISVGTNADTGETVSLQYGHVIPSNSGQLSTETKTMALSAVKGHTDNNETAFSTYYLGNQARPMMKLISSVEGEITKSGNYTISYNEGAGGGYDAGSTVTVTITADPSSPKYYGEIVLYYKVLQIKDATFLYENNVITDPNNDQYAFTGEEVEVYPTLTYDTTTLAAAIDYEGTEKKTTLTKGADYTLTTTGSLSEVGTKTVTVTFTGNDTNGKNFQGSHNRTVTITTADPKDITIGPSADVNYRNENPSDPGKALERQGTSAPYTYQFGRTLPYTGGDIIAFTTELTNGSTNGAWNLYYAGKIIDPSKYTVSYFSNEAMTTPATPNESGNYYFDINLSVGSVKNFGNNAHIYGSFAIAGRDLSTAILVPEATEYIYDTHAHKPGFSLIYENQTITLDPTKYDVEYVPIAVPVPGSTTETRVLGDTACKNPGLYQIRVTGKAGSNFASNTVKTCDYKIIGKFLNSSSSLLDIKEKNDTDNKVEGNSYEIHKEQTLSGDIYKSEFEEKEFYLHFDDTDFETPNRYAGFFTVTGKDLTVPGNGTVTVSSNSEYFTGSKTYRVKAVGLLSDIEITGWAPNNTYAYDGAGVDVLPTNLLITYNTKVLTEGRDYSVTASGASDIGEAQLQITPGTNGFFTGSKTAAYYVCYDLNKARINITSPASYFVYNGVDKNPTYTVTYPSSSAANGEETIPLAAYEEDATRYKEVGPGYIVLNPVDGKSFNSKQQSFTITGIDVDDASKVSFDPIANQTYTGLDIKPTITAKLNNTTPMILGTDYTVTYSANKNAGTATVTVKGINNFTGTKTLHFTIDPRNLSNVTLTLLTTQVPYNGGANVVLNEGTDYTVTDGSAVLVKDRDYTVVVDARNSVTDPSNPNDPGPGYVTISGIAGGNYTGSKTSDTGFTVVAANIASGDVEVDQHSAEYTGSALDPANFITLKMNGQTLNNTCFSISIQGVNGTTIQNVDTYTITLTGTAPNYTGTKTINNFEITPKELDTTRFTWALNQTAFPYDGNEVTPSLVTHADNTLGNLTPGTDYEVSYDHNIEAGSANDSNGPVVIVTGKGNYTGEVKLHFSIGTDMSSATATLNLPSVYPYQYDGAEHKPTVKKVTLGTTDLKSNQYTVTYPTDMTSVGTKTITIKGTNGYYGTITKDYDIVKRTPADGEVLIIPKDYDKIDNKGTVADRSDDEYAYIYPGKNAVDNGWLPEIEVYDTVARANLSTSDYEVIDNGYINCDRVGTASVTIRLKGNYNTANVTKTFEILPRSISDANTAATVSYDAEQEWTGSAIEPDVTVTDDRGNDLVKGTDYTITFENNTNVGTADEDASFTVTGIGNYEGTIEKTFVIYGDLQNAQVSAIPEMFCTNAKIIPHPTIVCGGRELKEGEDYTLDSYSNDGFTQEGYLRISAIDQVHYKNGPRDEYFTIGNNPASLTVKVPKPSYAYTGAAIKPDVTVTDAGGSVLENDPNHPYEITYSSDADGETCKAVGTVTVTVMVPTSGGNTVPATGTYEITKRHLNDCRVAAISNEAYTGQALEPTVTITVGDNELTEGTDFEVAYSNNTNVGVATITVTGIGNCEGTRELVFAIAPATMTNVTAYGISENSILVRWTAQSYVDGYELTYTVNGKTKTVTTANTSYTITGLSAGTSYTINACTYVTYGGQTYKGIKTPVTASTYIAAPSYLVTSTAKKQATLSWNTATFNGGYMIYRSDKPNTGFTHIASVPSTYTTWTDKNVTSGKTYYYKLKAYQIVNGKPVYNIGVESAVKGIKVK